VNLSYSAEYEEFRREVRAFLAEHWTAEDKAAVPAPDPGSVAAALGGSNRADERATAFRLKAIARGYLYRHIPRRYGGSEQAPDALRATIIA
jgi:alkylation response protein AidB-like acyl-CoA dehydrogenase